ncbi:MAG: hypothetical protein NT023_18965 [Armatimonadetes bacterium]|nr:hypothetical protein [Armatimonadota bacterium]
MKSKVSPLAAIFVLLLVGGVALGIMFYIADKPGPPMPTSMGGAMQSKGGAPPAGGGGKKGGGGMMGGKPSAPPAPTDKKAGEKPKQDADGKAPKSDEKPSGEQK